jgi:hypothetical protein
MYITTSLLTFGLCAIKAVSALPPVPLVPRVINVTVTAPGETISSAVTLTQTVTECCSDVCSKKTLVPTVVSPVVTITTCDTGACHTSAAPCESCVLSTYDSTYTTTSGESTITVYSPCATFVQPTEVTSTPVTLTQTVTECCSEVCSKKTLAPTVVSPVVTLTTCDTDACHTSAALCENCVLSTYDTSYTTMSGERTVTVYSPCATFVQPTGKMSTTTNPGTVTETAACESCAAESSAAACSGDSCPSVAAASGAKTLVASSLAIFVGVFALLL